MGRLFLLLQLLLRPSGAPVKDASFRADRSVPQTHSLLALGVLLAACAHTSRPAQPIAGCVQPCAALAEVTFPDRVELTVQAPPGAQLQNATVTSASRTGCTAGVPVAQVWIDQVELPEGPAGIEGLHRVSLRFPFTDDWDAPQADLPPPVAVDLDLTLPGGQPRCLRVAMPADDASWISVAQGLSYRLQQGQ